MSDRRQHYLSEGYVVVRRLVADEAREVWCSDLDTRLVSDTGLAALDPDLDPVARDIATYEPLVDLASELLAGPVAAFGVTYVVKAPHHGLMALWHQDGHPWRSRLGGAPAVTLWVALDDMHFDNGALSMVPGSHRTPLRELVPVSDPPNLFGWRSPDELTASIDDSVVMVMDPGDVSAHHPAMIHGSGPNTTSAPRRAISIRYRGLST